MNNVTLKLKIQVPRGPKLCPQICLNIGLVPERAALGVHYLYLRWAEGWCNTLSDYHSVSWNQMYVGPWMVALSLCILPSWSIRALLLCGKRPHWRCQRGLPSLVNWEVSVSIFLGTNSVPPSGNAEPVLMSAGSKYTTWISTEGLQWQNTLLSLTSPVNKKLSQNFHIWQKPGSQTGGNFR